MRCPDALPPSRTLPRHPPGAGRAPGRRAPPRYLAAQMVAGIDKYLTRELAASVEKRKALWKPDYSSAEAYTRSVEPNREHLRHILGVVDKRVPFQEVEYIATTSQPALVAEGTGY